ncbi:MAG: ribosome maturation factor RimM [Sciscionella sp.]|nr:ribosome maturation factor RimM [Sciscionella sp.]
MADVGQRRAVGRVVKAHGVRGELTVEVLTDAPEHRFAIGAHMTAAAKDGTERTLTVASTRPHSARLLVTFEEVAGRDAAEALRGVLLLAEVSELPPIEDPDEFYDHQLEGIEVSTVDGQVIGEVREVLHGPAGELLAVQRKAGGEVLIPFVREIVPTVDLAAGRVLVDPPEGLLG